MSTRAARAAGCGTVAPAQRKRANNNTELGAQTMFGFLFNTPYIFLITILISLGLAYAAGLQFI